MRATSGAEAKGWRLFRTDVPDEDDEPTLAGYCAVWAYVESEARGENARNPTERATASEEAAGRNYASDPRHDQRRPQSW